jgi:hypothetical protein
MSKEFRYYWIAIICGQILAVVLLFVLNDRGMPLADTIVSLRVNRDVLCAEHKTIAAADRMSHICGKMDLDLSYVNHFFKLRNSFTEKTIYFLILMTVFSNIMIYLLTKIRR